MNIYLKQISELNSLFDDSDNSTDLRLNLVALLIEAKLDVEESEFRNIENAAEVVFSSNCGCSEDLIEMNEIFETLAKYEIFNADSQNRIIKNSPCNRWL